MLTLYKAGGTAKITRANIVTELHKISYVGITKTVKFKTNGNIYARDDLHLPGEVRKDRPTRQHETPDRQSVVVAQL